MKKLNHTKIKIIKIKGELQMINLNINQKIADLSKLNQATTDSAQHFGNNFTTQLEVLSNSFTELSQAISNTFKESSSQMRESFSDSFTGIDEIVQTSKLMMKESLEETLAAVKDSTSYMKEMYSETFAGVNELSLYNKLLMTESLEDIVEATKETTELIRESFHACTEAVNYGWLNFGFMYTDLLENMRLMSYGKFNQISEFGKHAAENIKLSFGKSFDETLGKLNSLKESMEPILENIGKTFSETAQYAKLAFKEATESINGNFDEMGEQGKESNSILGRAYDFLLERLRNINMVLGIFNGILNLSTAILSGHAAATIAAAKAFLVKAAASAKAAIAAAAFKISITMGVAAAPIAAGLALGGAALAATIGLFAQGGFPERGQMFVAREAGPELVGTIGSRNAVVNNDQIVEAVSLGVYRAVRDAMGGNNSNNKPTEVKLYLDGKQITAAVERTQMERGLPLLGGLSFG